jgi:hypothetical protein
MLLASPMTSIIYGDTVEPEEEPEIEPEEEEAPEEEEEEAPEEEEEDPPEPEEELEDEEEDEEIDVEVLAQLYQNREQIEEQLRIHLMEEFGNFDSFDELEGKVHQSIMNSLKHAEQAFENVDAGKWSNPEASANQLQRGMKHYSNAMLQFSNYYYEEELEDEDEEPEVEVEIPEEDEVNEHKMKLMFQYHEDFQNRVQEMTETMNQIMNQLSEGDQHRTTSAIMNTILKLERIQARLDQGEINEAIDEAEEAEEEFEEALSMMENQQLSLMLKTMYKMGAKIQQWENKMERRQEEGLDFTDVQDLVNQLRIALEDAQNDIEAGNYVNAEGILNQAFENAKGKGKGKNKGN